MYQLLPSPTPERYLGGCGPEQYPDYPWRTDGGMKDRDKTGPEEPERGEVWRKVSDG